MRRYSLQTRLSLSHALVTLAGLLLLGATLVALVGNAQRETTLTTLGQQAQVYATYATSVAADTQTLSSLAPTLSAYVALAPDTVLRVMAPDGGVLYATGDLGRFPSNAALPYLNPPLPIQLVAPETERRFVAVPVARNAQPIGVIELSQPVQRERDLVRQLLGALVPSVLLALGGAALGGHLLARTLVRPLHHLGRVARAVTRGDLQSRSADHSPDEIGQLAIQLNQMTDELQARLGQVEQLADARQQFYRSVSHELRTPLTAIRGAAENLDDDALPDQQASLQIIQLEAARLQRLVEELLHPRDDAPLPMRQRQPLDLQILVEEARQIMLPRAHRVGISLRATSTSMQILGDDDRLKQALLNLLDNALWWTPAGGKVVIEAHPDGDQARVLVCDTGPGIQPSLRSQVWERGISGSGGQGLGLALVRDIVHAHGGSVALLDGPGTIIELRLPLATL